MSAFHIMLVVTVLLAIASPMLLLMILLALVCGGIFVAQAFGIYYFIVHIQYNINRLMSK